MKQQRKMRSRLLQFVLFMGMYVYWTVFDSIPAGAAPITAAPSGNTVLAFPSPIPGLGSVANFFNPFSYLNDQLKSLNQAALQLIEHTIISPPNITGTDWQNYLLANSLSTGEYLSLVGTFMSWAIATVWLKRSINAVQSLLILILIRSFGPLYWPAFDWFQGIGGHLAAGIQSKFPKGHTADLLNFPSIDNVVGSLAAVVVTLIGGFWLAGLFFIYTQVNFLVKFLLPMLLPGIAFSELFKKFIDVLISLGIVGCVAAQPITMIIVEMGSYALTTVPVAWQGALPFYKVGVLGSTFVVALVMQLILLVVLYKATSKVTGRVKSSITGQVEVFTRNRLQTDVNSFRQNQAEAMRVTPTQASGEQRGTVSAIGHVVKEQAISAAVQAGANYVAPGSGPAIDAKQKQIRRAVQDKKSA